MNSSAETGLPLVCRWALDSVWNEWYIVRLGTSPDASPFHSPLYKTFAGVQMSLSYPWFKLEFYHHEEVLAVKAATSKRWLILMMANYVPSPSGWLEMLGNKKKRQDITIYYFLFLASPRWKDIDLFSTLKLLHLCLWYINDCKRIDIKQWFTAEITEAKAGRVRSVNTPCQPVILHLHEHLSRCRFTHDRCTIDTQCEFLLVAQVGKMHGCYFCSAIQKFMLWH